MSASMRAAVQPAFFLPCAAFLLAIHPPVPLLCLSVATKDIIAVEQTRASTASGNASSVRMYCETALPSCSPIRTAAPRHLYACRRDFLGKKARMRNLYCWPGTSSPLCMCFPAHGCRRHPCALGKARFLHLHLVVKCTLLCCPAKSNARHPDQIGGVVGTHFDRDRSTQSSRPRCGRECESHASLPGQVRDMRETRRL